MIEIDKQDYSSNRRRPSIDSVNFRASRKSVLLSSINHLQVLLADSIGGWLFVSNYSFYFSQQIYSVEEHNKYNMMWPVFRRETVFI